MVQSYISEKKSNKTSWIEIEHEFSSWPEVAVFDEVTTNKLYSIAIMRKKNDCT